MEHDDTQIKCIIAELIFILESNDELQWATTLKNLLVKYSIDNNIRDLSENIIDIYKGGMGSFADLVLQKNMKMLVEKNNVLARLKHDLFNSCMYFVEQKNN